MRAAQEIEHLHDDFRLEWSHLASLIREEDGQQRVAESLELLRRFVAAIHTVVKQETDAWIAVSRTASFRLNGVQGLVTQKGPQPSRAVVVLVLR